MVWISDVGVEEAQLGVAFTFFELWEYEFTCSARFAAPSNFHTRCALLSIVRAWTAVFVRAVANVDAH